ncbi:uncharacterized protein K460DRAFT_281039 [Cucurbitaria berberidis CBS 394.84]|uniref:Zn(2)-C6 fungal-type domain-containing protein n=1 Tax=Cucurbitaria berberidis CBS 394.84 TaxID=1168544 RepID=A0A9P4GM02_9PLEO|nr:uncharacterized protein K460DRAFT_281039 [Cucurbitaria berberidis CBS 394.84]KAF1847526.1 hypothetical protein K460DRAFT_281039 [Cucurbitaria berberidis CBS 394.84]
MEHLQDELDLRFHKGLQPDVYYRCPTTESLHGALRNELEKSASSLIPTEIVTEFVFSATSTITIPVTYQTNLDILIEPADFLQSIAVDYALCRDIDGKERLKLQRAIARSIIEAIQDADGFKYAERHAQNREGGDGTRLKYVCLDSFQNRDRKSNMKKEKPQESEDSEGAGKKKGPAPIPTYDCGGAIHIKFSIKREAINVVYKHNPIHTRPANGDDSNLPALAIGYQAAHQAPTPDATNGTKKRKRKTKKDEVEVQVQVDASRDHYLDMSTSPEAPRSSTRKKRTKETGSGSPKSNQKSTAKKGKKAKEPLSPSKSFKVNKPSPPPKPIKGRACIRCREKGIKCNESKPTCNQCQRGLWTCQYDVPGGSKRSKNGCLNCKQRKRKCTEERPSCAHCLRLGDDCEYADDH